MRKSSCLVLALLGLAACTWSRPIAHKPRTADEVIDKYVDAIGGRERLAARRSMRITARLEFPKGIEGRLIQELERPNKYRQELTLPEGARLIQAYDGTTAWHTARFLEDVDELPPDLARFVIEQADLDGPLVGYREKGHQVSLIGEEVLEGAATYRLRLIRKGAKEGDHEDYFIDASTFLPAAVRASRTVGGIAVETETIVGDYRPVEGILIAHTVRERQGLSKDQESVRTVEAVEIDIDIPDERFSIDVARKLAGETRKPEPVPVIRNDPAARALYNGMIASMRAADSLSFESKYQLRVDGRPAVRCGYKIWLKKPNHFRMEGFKADGKRGGILVGDGDHLWVYWPDGRPRLEMNEPDYENTRYNVYMTKPTPQARHSIGHEAKWLGVGMIMTIFDLSTFHGYTDSLQPYLDAVGGCGTETIGDEACDVIDVSYMDGQRTWRIWISTRNRLPRKLKETVRVRVPIEVEETWTNLSVDSDLPDHLFAWKPPEGWKEWRRQATETKLLEPGTPAPEFELKLADGKTTRLSDHRGKVVLVVFWRGG